MEDELRQGCQPKSHTPAFSHAGSSSALRGVAAAWLCFLQWPQDLCWDTLGASLVNRRPRRPHLARKVLGRYTSTKFRKTILRRLIFRAHTSMMTDDITGPTLTALQKRCISNRVSKPPKTQKSSSNSPPTQWNIKQSQKRMNQIPTVRCLNVWSSDESKVQNSLLDVGKGEPYLFSSSLLCTQLDETCSKNFPFLAPSFTHASLAGHEWRRWPSPAPCFLEGRK